MSLSADVEGVDRLVDSLDRAADQLRHLDHDPAADILTPEARRRTPVDRGRLVDTVRTVSTDTGPVLTAGSDQVDYAPYVHARTPFLAATITDTTARLVDAYALQVDQVVGRIEGK